MNEPASPTMSCEPPSAPDRNAEVMRVFAGETAEPRHESGAVHQRDALFRLELQGLEPSLPINRFRRANPPFLVDFTPSHHDRGDIGRGNQIAARTYRAHAGDARDEVFV